MTLRRKTGTLRFRRINKDIFDAIRSGKKKVETRAATVKYRDIQTGDKLAFVCGKERFEKTIKRATIFKTIPAMLRVYRVPDIAPNLSTVKELRDLYYGFPGYREKIKEYGLIALELK
jgi:ASC-1-like (ASCH) protein